LAWGALEPFIALFIIMDPLGSLPVFWHFTHKLTEERRDWLANRTFVLASIVLSIFLFFGLRILDVFGVSLGSFKVAGGIILLIMGVRMVIGYTSHEERVKSYEDAIVPIAIPLLVGPGMITTTILFVGEYGYFLTIGAAVATLFVSWIIFRNAARLMGVFGRQGSDAISRLMGMLIVAFAVQFIKDGWGAL
jgi:multiple antibiotic resistance protein